MLLERIEHERVPCNWLKWSSNYLKERLCQLPTMWKKLERGQEGNCKLPSLRTTVLWGCTLCGSMRACRTELCDADSVCLSRSWSSRCLHYSSWQIALYVIYITVYYALWFVGAEINLWVTGKQSLLHSMRRWLHWFSWSDFCIWRDRHPSLHFLDSWASLLPYNINSQRSFSPQFPLSSTQMPGSHWW